MTRPVVWFVVLLVLLPGCGVPADDSVQTTGPSSQSTTPTVEVSDAFRQDAATMAKDMGISVDEAIRRLQLQGSIGTLVAALEQHEAGTFAGLWIQHEPVYRVAVAFTRNGPETIRPYIANTPLADVIDVRSANVTYAELKVAQQKTQQLLQGLSLSVASGINIQENRVELYVTDRTLFDTTLQQANVHLPDHVVVMTVYEPVGSTLPFAVTPDPTIAFPQLKMRSAAFMEALAAGELIVQNGCLRVQAHSSTASHLIIWQADYFLNKHNGTIEILDRNGAVVARVGDEIRMGGGEVPLTPDLERQLREPVLKQCEGPYWLMGELEKHQ